MIEACEIFPAEKEIIIDGIRYIAIKSDKDCSDCIFYMSKNLCDFVACGNWERKDKTESIWIRS